jgi:hypothetical protein
MDGLSVAGRRLVRGVGSNGSSGWWSHYSVACKKACGPCLAQPERNKIGCSESLM